MSDAENGGVAPGESSGSIGDVAGPDWDRAVALIRRAERLLLCSHRKPDGDAIGSLLGFGYALEAAGKQVTLACADPAGGSLRKLPGAERIVSDLAPLYSPDRPLPWDVAVVMDASGLDRLGALYESNRDLFAALPVVNVDHHFTNDRFGAANVVEPGAASATEVLTRLLERLGYAPDARAATCLLAGMMTDSLSFQTESTTPATLRAAASLVEAGAPLATLAYDLFRQRTVPNALLWARATSTLQLTPDGRIAWVEIPRRMVEEAGEGAETSGLSGFAGSIEGVLVGFQLEEAKDGTIYGGFRSQTVDVAAIAAEFGGGGHKRAAGCHFPPPTTFAEARARVLEVIERHLTGQSGG